MSAARFAPYLAAEAAARQKAGTLAPIGAKGKSSEIAAAKFGVSKSSVERAQVVLRTGTPELVQAKERQGARNDLSNIPEFVPGSGPVPTGDSRDHDTPVAVIPARAQSSGTLTGCNQSAALTIGKPVLEVHAMADRKSTRPSGAEITRAMLTLDKATRRRIAFEESGDLLADCIDHILTGSPQESFEVSAWSRYLATGAGLQGGPGALTGLHQSVYYTMRLTVGRLDDMARLLRKYAADRDALARYQVAMAKWLEAQGDDEDDDEAAENRRWVIYALTDRKPHGISWDSMARTVAKYHREQLPLLVQ